MTNKNESEDPMGRRRNNPVTYARPQDHSHDWDQYSKLFDNWTEPVIVLREKLRKGEVKLFFLLTMENMRGEHQYQLLTEQVLDHVFDVFGGMPKDRLKELRLIVHEVHHPHGDVDQTLAKCATLVWFKPGEDFRDVADFVVS